MKHRLFISIFALALPFLASAQTRLRNPVARIMEPQNLVDLIVLIVQFIGGPIVVFGIIYAGYTIVSAQGETKQLEKGKMALTWSIIGAAVILGATVLKTIIGNTVTEIFSNSV